MSALLLSLIIIPIATELPEKVNSILWARRGKDTLAFGNITGAMVFQGTLLPAIGIMLTPWEPRLEVLTGVLITLAAAAWLRFNARRNGVVLWALLGKWRALRRVSRPDARALKEAEACTNKKCPPRRAPKSEAACHPSARCSCCSYSVLTAAAGKL